MITLIIGLAVFTVAAYLIALVVITIGAVIAGGIKYLADCFKEGNG